MALLKKLTKERRQQMKLNIPAIKELINVKYRGNQSFFADEIDIAVSYLNQILNGRRNDNSSRVCNNIIVYCEKNNMDYKKYIFLD